jgi:hypothetical protein
MDKRGRSPPISLKGLLVDRFDHTASWPEKVRNVSRPASQNERSVRLCYDVIVRTTLDIPDEAYYLAKAIARDQNRSLGRVVGDLILQSSKGAKSASITISDYGFPTFRCARPVTTEDVRALDDEE